MAIGKSKFEKYLNEIKTFADDAKDVIIDPNGTICFNRLNQVMEIRFVERDDKMFVVYNGSEMPYRLFMAKHLASMEIMARRILDKDPKLDDHPYVDGDAVLATNEGKTTDKALSLLDYECKRDVFIGSKICFVTANAGHGKTMLLRQYQKEQALKYLKGNTDFLFIHIDLHGHDLRKLDTVIMYEMAGVLRMPGIYTNSIITLMRNGLIVLGVDGFDELAVETGGEKAIGSFNNLVRDLDSQGVLIAASRRTFFNTQDYVKRKGYLDDVNDAFFCFDEIRLQNWGEEQCTEYMQWVMDGMTPEKAKTEYEKVLSFLTPSTNNPLVERPFIFTNIVECAQRDNLSLYEYLRAGGDNDQALDRIINSFINREVIKWNNNNLTDKREYLTFDQHKQLLATIADEMWVSQREYVSLDIIEFDLSVLLEEWKILPNLQPDILKMSKSHAFLVSDSHGDNYRRFDHEEFKNYFLAKKLESLIIEAQQKKAYDRLRRFLSIGQLPDAVAMYLAQFSNDIDKPEFVINMLDIVKKEMRTTFLHTNLGTLIPFMLDNVNLSDLLVIEGKLVFSSIVFENKKLENITFKDCYFVNISFCRTQLRNVRFVGCDFNDIRLEDQNTCSFSNVSYDETTQIQRVSEYSSDNTIVTSEFIPVYVEEILGSHNIKNEKLIKKNVQRKNNSDYRKAVTRFLNKFNTSSSLYEKNLKEDPIYNSRYYDAYIDDIIPLMEKHHIIKEVQTNNSRQQSTRAWALDSYDLKYILESENVELSPLSGFWEEVNSRKI